MRFIGSLKPAQRFGSDGSGTVFLFRPRLGILPFHPVLQDRIADREHANPYPPGVDAVRDRLVSAGPGGA